MEGRFEMVKNVFSNPVFGMASIGTGAAPSLFHLSTPMLQYWALLLGVCIGFVTLVLKLNEFYVKVIKRK